MYVMIDLDRSPATVELAHSGDFQRFHVLVQAGGENQGGRPSGRARSSLEAVLDAGEGIGRLIPGGDEAFIGVGALRALARDQVDPDWSESFAKMVDFARSKGWMDPEGEALQAHIEWIG